MHKVQEKYVFLHKFDKPNSDWVENANYVDFLYSNEEEHLMNTGML